MSVAPNHALCDPVRIELLGEPRGKGRPRFVRATGHAYNDPRTRSYESRLRVAAQDAMGSRKPIEGGLRVDVLAAMSIPMSWPKNKRAAAALGFIRPEKKPDIDNIMKILDSLNEVVWRDDSQIVEATICKRYGDRPSLRIIVREIAVGASRQEQVADV